MYNISAVFIKRQNQTSINWHCYIFLYTQHILLKFDKNGMTIYKSIQNTYTLFDIKVILISTKGVVWFCCIVTSSLKNFKSIVILSLSSFTVIIIFEWTYFRILLCLILIFIIKIDSGDWGDLRLSYIISNGRWINIFICTHIANWLWSIITGINHL